MYAKIGNVKIGKINEFVEDVSHLIKTGRYKERGKCKVKKRGFGNEGRNEAYNLIAKVAAGLEAKIAVIDKESSTKRGVYKASVSFYKDTIDLNRREYQSDN